MAPLPMTMCLGVDFQVPAWSRSNTRTSILGVPLKSRIRIRNSSRALLQTLVIRRYCRLFSFALFSE